MTDLKITDIILVLIGLTNLLGQWYFRSSPSLPGSRKEVKPFVTPTSRAFTNENKIGQEDSAIVEPKTPQRIAFEEEEELRKIGLGNRGS